MRAAHRAETPLVTSCTVSRRTPAGFGSGAYGWPRCPDHHGHQRFRRDGVGSLEWNSLAITGFAQNGCSRRTMPGVGCPYWAGEMNRPLAVLIVILFRGRLRPGRTPRKAPPPRGQQRPLLTRCRADLLAAAGGADQCTGQAGALGPATGSQVRGRPGPVRYSPGTDREGRRPGSGRRGHRIARGLRLQVDPGARIPRVPEGTGWIEPLCS